MTRVLSALHKKMIRESIRDGHLAFLAEIFGPGVIDRVDYDRLVASGRIRPERSMPQDAASAVHVIGMLSGDDHADVLEGRVGDSNRLLTDPSEFWSSVVDDPHIATEVGREVIASLRDRMAQHVRRLSSKLEDVVDHVMIDIEDRHRRRRLTKTASTNQEPPLWEEIADRVRKATVEVRRDWLRCVHTEFHNTVEESKAVVFARRDAKRDPRVFKRPRADACSYCRLLFLKPDGVTPRVFRLSKLLMHGTNVGRFPGRPTRSGGQRTQWRAVVGAVHPFCGCALHVLPDGMGFDARGAMIRVGLKKSSNISTEEDEIVDTTDHVCEDHS